MANLTEMLYMEEQRNNKILCNINLSNIDRLITKNNKNKLIISEYRNTLNNEYNNILSDYNRKIKELDNIINKSTKLKNKLSNIHNTLNNTLWKKSTFTIEGSLSHYYPIIFDNISNIDTEFILMYQNDSEYHMLHIKLKQFDTENNLPGYLTIDKSYKKCNEPFFKYFNYQGYSSDIDFNSSLDYISYYPAGYIKGGYTYTLFYLDDIIRDKFSSITTTQKEISSYGKTFYFPILTN